MMGRAKKAVKIVGHWIRRHQDLPAYKYTPLERINNGDTIQIIMPWPPSVNSGYWIAKKMYTRGGKPYLGKALSNDAVAYRQLCAAACYNQSIMDLFGDRKISLDIHWHPQKSDTDIDNFSKALFDGMEHARVWENDRQIVSRADHMRKSIKGGMVVMYARLANDAEIEMQGTYEIDPATRSGLW